MEKVVFMKNWICDNIHFGALVLKKVLLQNVCLHVGQRWRQNYSINFQQIWNIHFNYADILVDARYEFVENFESCPFLAKTPKNLFYFLINKVTNDYDQI